MRSGGREWRGDSGRMWVEGWRGGGMGGGGYCYLKHNHLKKRKKAGLQFRMHFSRDTRWEWSDGGGGVEGWRGGGVEE